MKASMRALRKELLTLLLDAYERSGSYGKSGPWPRDVILKLDAKTFPEAFEAGGRGYRAALLAAIEDLERDRCVRVIRHVKGPLAKEAKEIRLGPNEVAEAYSCSRLLGYEPLSAGLQQIAKHADTLARQNAPDWMHDFLRRLVADLSRADTLLLGMKRERFKREWPHLVPCLTAAVALAAGVVPGWERVVSERLFNDSKLLGRLRTYIVAILVAADPRWEGIPPEEASELLEVYGVRRKPGLIRCAGAAVIDLGKRKYDSLDFQPVAHLPEAWANSWIDGLSKQETQLVTTIENEYPFLSYVEHAGGPAGLGERKEVALYTSGFPTPALISTLLRLREEIPSIRFRHWGDADVGGLRIWWFLRSRLQVPVQPFRTTAEWMDKEAQNGGRPLSQSERAALKRLWEKLSPIDGEDITAARNLIERLLRYGIKIEQERF
jgi:hypothetical protein